MMMLLAGLQAVAQPTIVSTVPSNGATGVSPGAAVVIHFSTAMDPTMTSTIFSDVTASESPTVVSAWSAGNTVLTCTPSPVFANNHNIQWNVIGQDAVGNALTGTTGGGFTTVPGVNGGSGTNAFTAFQVSKYAVYSQTSNGPASFLSYEFFGQTTLASNRTATNVTVTIPVTAGVTNLNEDPLQPERFSKGVFSPNVTNFNTNFPTGDYVFNIFGSSPQQTTVNLPNYAQPNAPQIVNYTAAQAVDPSQPFTLTWNTFTNGTVADGILIQITESGVTLFQTLGFGQPGGFNGTTTSVIVPAGTLPPNSTNNGSLFFGHLTSVTNGGNTTLAAVASVTLFSVTTTGGSATGPAPGLTIIPAGTNVLVEWPTNATGYTLQYSTDLASSAWSTNLPAPGIVSTNRVVTNGISGTQRFFRLSKP
jgi:methionine-rich copper-binding protein CopC